MARSHSKRTRVSQKDKRLDPEYIQLSNFVRKGEVLRFKTICAAKGISISEGLEAAIKLWSNTNEVSLGQKTYSSTEDQSDRLQQDTGQLPPEE